MVRMKRLLRFACLPLVMYGVLKVTGKPHKPVIAATRKTVVAVKRSVSVSRNPWRGLGFSDDCIAYGELLKKWQAWLSLDHQEISFRIATAKTLGPDKLADVTRRSPGSPAFIRFLCSTDLAKRKPGMALPFEREHLVVHELTHLVLDGLEGRAINKWGTTETDRLEAATDEIAYTLQDCSYQPCKDRDLKSSFTIRLGAGPWHPSQNDKSRVVAQLIASMHQRDKYELALKEIGSN